MTFNKTIRLINEDFNQIEFTLFGKSIFSEVISAEWFARSLSCSPLF